MVTYNIRTTAWPIWILTMFGTLATGGILIAMAGIKNEGIALVIMLGPALASFYLQRFTSRGELEISITDTSIILKYLKQSFLSNKPDRIISFNDIDSYKYQPDRNFDMFKLTLRDEVEIRIWHYTGLSSDDFEKLVTDFPEIVANHNERAENISSNSTQTGAATSKPFEIKREKALFEGRAGFVLAVLAMIFIVAFIYLLVTKKITSASAGFGLLASISGAVFFLMQFFQYRKKQQQ